MIGVSVSMLEVETRMMRAVGLMSGTSADGIDVALIRTDGEAVAADGPWASYAHDEATRSAVLGAFGGRGDVEAAARAVTSAHAKAVGRFLAETGTAPGDVDIIGFHGQTILHEPENGRTWQIGDGAALAAEIGIDVIDDFRAADVAAGGEGAPFAPAYHRALAHGLERPLAVLNLGGVANVTYIGEDDDLIAFDTGPGNALIDDWVRARSGARMDEEGRLAASGRVERTMLAALLANDYFDRPAPKSLDRDHFDTALLAGLDPADGAATLAAFTIAAVVRARDLLPAPPRRWLVTGGGRLNGHLMAGLRAALDAQVAPVEAVGWRGDALEAEAFAFLAVRSLKGLALSFPGTTGVARPMTGGRHHAA